MNIAVKNDDIPTQDLIFMHWQERWSKGYVDDYGQWWCRHEHQRPPDDVDPQWFIWLMLAGRGAGKTRGAAEWIGRESWRFPKTRSLVSGPTSSDIRDTIFEGESGLLAVIPQPLIKNYNRSLHELVLINESLIKGIPATEPERFRGPQFHRAWADELAAWEFIQESYDMLMFGLRLGKLPRLIITTTPKPRKLIRQLVKDAANPKKHIIVTRASTYDNLKYLAPTFRDSILKYEGTKLGRQEINAEIIDPEESGIIQRSWFRLWPHHKPLPELEFVLISLDTAYTEETYDKRKQEPDFSAGVTLGLFTHQEAKAIIVLDTWEERLGLPALITKAKKEMKLEWGTVDQPLIKPLIGPNIVHGSGHTPDLMLIEDKGSGISLRQMLAKEGIFTYPYNPHKAKKLDRLHAISHIVAGGFVWVVESENPEKKGQPKSWYEPMIEQTCTYSGANSIEHDDSMDAFVQGVRFLADRNYITITKQTDDDEQLTYVPPQQNPYAA